MKKNLPIIFTLLILIFLSACGASNESATAETESPQITDSISDSRPAAQCTVQSQVVADLARPGDHITGAREDSAITIITYNEFTCEGCVTIASALVQAVELYPDDIRLIYRHFTSPAKNPLVAARAAESAGKQGKFNSMYELFFTDYQPWIDLNEEGINDLIWDQVTALELNPDQFFEDISSQEISDQIEVQYSEAFQYVELLQGSIHGTKIASAAEAAGRQNQFWAMYQKIFFTQDIWQVMDVQSLNNYLIEQADALQLDLEKFQQDFDFLSDPKNDVEPLRRALNYFSLFYRIPLGVVAAKVSEAAGNQGKFWEMHDLLFANQSLWVDLDEPNFLNFISGQLENLEIDPDQFFNDYYSPTVEEIILEHYLQARVSNTPAPVVQVNGSATPPYISTIGDFLLWLDNLMIPFGRHIRDQQFYECPPLTIDTNDQYTATLHTEKGDIVLALYPDAAPFAVNSFIFLAEQDYYDNSPFYAVIEGFVAQAGDPSLVSFTTSRRPI
jgi:protein-disulfide isomerase